MDAIAPDVELASTETGMAHGGRPQLHVLPSAKRTLLFAMLAWAPTYTGIIEAEHAMHEVLLDQMQADWASSYMLRKMASRDPTVAAAARARLMDRVNEAAGSLERMANVNYIPFSQAVKGVSYLFGGVSAVWAPACACGGRLHVCMCWHLGAAHSVTHVHMHVYTLINPTHPPQFHWGRERALRRVVGRPFAMAVLNAMADCRPRPDFEVSDWLWSIAFDQTYVRKSGASTGTTRYRAVQTVDERGNPVVPDRLVYINGQDYAAPAFHLPPAVATLISRVGPYTQDFRRVLPHLDPTRMDRVMDDLLVRTATLLTGVVTGLGAPTRDVVASLLSRPNVDPGGPTYTTFLPCLLATLQHCFLRRYDAHHWLDARLHWWHPPRAARHWRWPECSPDARLEAPAATLVQACTSVQWPLPLICTLQLCSDSALVEAIALRVL